MVQRAKRHRLSGTCRRSWGCWQFGMPPAWATRRAPSSGTEKPGPWAWMESGRMTHGTEVPALDWAAKALPMLVPSKKSMCGQHIQQSIGRWSAEGYGGLNFQLCGIQRFAMEHDLLVHDLKALVLCCGWTKSCTTIEHLDFSKKANKQWCPMVSLVVQEVLHPQQCFASLGSPNMDPHPVISVLELHSETLDRRNPHEAWNYLHQGLLLVGGNLVALFSV